MVSTDDGTKGRREGGRRRTLSGGVGLYSATEPAGRTTVEAMRTVQERAARFGAALRLLWFAATAGRSAAGRAHRHGVPGHGRRPRAPGAARRRDAAAGG